MCRWSRLHPPDIAAEVAARGIVAEICAKELIQAGIVKAFYITRLEVKPEVAEDYTRLQNRL